MSDDSSAVRESVPWSWWPVASVKTEPNDVIIDDDDDDGFLGLMRNTDIGEVKFELICKLSAMQTINAVGSGMISAGQALVRAATNSEVASRNVLLADANARSVTASNVNMSDVVTQSVTVSDVTDVTITDDVIAA